MNDNVTHVFLSISGNDLNFPGLLIGCMGNAPATCLANIDSTRTNLFPGALAGLRSTIEKIYAKAPQAQIILTGYAAMVGNGSPWGTNSGYLNAFGDEYQDDQIAVVKSLQKKGIDVDFVDISTVFLTHADGDTGSTWFFPPQFQLSPLRLARSSLHPNGAGENAIAGEVSDVVEKPYTGSCSGNVKQGMTGNCVREIQAHYNAWAKSLSPDGPQISVDGDFGPATYAAVRRFQTAKKLTVDGIVGPATKKSLFNY
jgi:lysophospholipase L1-like esterase